MNTFFKKKWLTPFAAVALAVVCIAGTFTGTYFLTKEKAPVLETLSAEQLYEASVEDAVFADDDEIKPLVTINKTSDMVSWNEAGDKILLLSWNKYPDSYPEGGNIAFKWGEVWTFTDKEIISWYKNNHDGVTDWNLRLKQLIGLPPESEYTHVSAFWVDPSDVIRPAYVTSIDKQMTNKFDDSVSGDYSEWFEDWFDGNTVWSYFDSAYPWTRLGYTYDWADNGTEYGLSEFIILPDSEAKVEFTKTTDEFISWMSEQAEK